MGQFDAAGFHPETANAWERRLLQRYIAKFGGDLDATPKTPQGQTLGIVSAGNAELDAFAVWLTNGLNPHSAEGYQLDDLGTLLGIDRNLATFSTVALTLTGVTGTVVASGTLITDANANEWSIDTDVTLASGDNAATATCTQPGPIQAAAGEINTVNSNVSGWETVNNAAPAVAGEAEQSDPSYRRNYPILTDRNATGTLRAIRAAMVVAGAGSDVSVFENDGAAYADVQSFGMPSGSILAVAEGGTDADLSAAVLSAKGMGVTTLTSVRGDETSDLTLSSLSSGLTITFNGTAITWTSSEIYSPVPGNWGVVATRLNAKTRAYGLSFHVSTPGSNRMMAVYPYSESGSGLATTGGADSIGFGTGDRIESPGAFVRPQAHALSITLAVTVYPGFPLDGLIQMRTALVNRIDAYSIGDRIFNHDLLAVAQVIPGSNITSIAVTDSASNNWNSLVPPLDTRWSLASGDITINVTQAT